MTPYHCGVDFSPPRWTKVHPTGLFVDRYLATACARRIPAAAGTLVRPQRARSPLARPLMQKDSRTDIIVADGHLYTLSPICRGPCVSRPLHFVVHFACDLVIGGISRRGRPDSGTRIGKRNVEREHERAGAGLRPSELAAGASRAFRIRSRSDSPRAGQPAADISGHRGGTGFHLQSSRTLHRPRNRRRVNARQVAEFLAGCHDLDADQVMTHLYDLHGRDSVHHLFLVASGGVSMVIGEAENHRAGETGLSAGLPAAVDWAVDPPRLSSGGPSGPPSRHRDGNPPTASEHPQRGGRRTGSPDFPAARQQARPDHWCRGDGGRDGALPAKGGSHPPDHRQPGSSACSRSRRVVAAVVPGPGQTCWTSWPALMW